MTSLRNRAGFTLIELMVVVVVIGIIASLAVPRLIGWSRASREAEAAPLLKQLYTLEERFYARENRYTTDIAELEGGTSVAGGGTHYGLGLTEDASGYCAVATPTAEGLRYDLSPRSMNALGELFESGDCR